MLHPEMFVLKTTDNTIIILNPFVFHNRQTSIPSGSWGHTWALLSSPRHHLSPAQCRQVLAQPWDATSNPSTAVSCLASLPGEPPQAEVLPSLGHPPSPGRLPCSLAGLVGWTPAAGPFPPCPGEPLQPLSPLQVGHSSLTPTFTFSTMYMKGIESEKMWLMLLTREKITFSSLSPTSSPTAAVSCEHLDLNLV